MLPQNPQQPQQRPQPTWFVQNRNWVIPMIILIAIVFCLSCLVVTGLAGYAFTSLRSPTAVPTAPYRPPAATEAPAVPAAPATANCSDNQTSSFSPRDPLVVDGVQTSIQFRDPNCPRAVFHTETGVAIGRNYKVVVPQGWSLGISAVSCAVQADGATQQTEYVGGPFIIIHGPWQGAIGCYEAGLHGLPAEWENTVLIGQILPIHRSETNKPADQPIFIP